MADTAAAHLALGVLGNVANFVFFVSSAPTVLRIIKSKSLHGAFGNLYLLQLLNCMLWTFYGLPVVHPNNIWVVITNSVGCVFAMLYILSHFWYSGRKQRWSLVGKLTVIVLSFTTIVLLLLLRVHLRDTRIKIAGIICVIVSSCMHITLLSQVGTALRINDAQYLHPASSVSAFVKGSIWTAYGIVNFDINIVIPNGVGIATGCVQLLVALLIWLRKERESIPRTMNQLKIGSDGVVEMPRQYPANSGTPSSCRQLPIIYPINDATLLEIAMTPRFKSEEIDLHVCISKQKEAGES